MAINLFFQTPYGLKRLVTENAIYWNEASTAKDVYLTYTPEVVVVGAETYIFHMGKENNGQFWVCKCSASGEWGHDTRVTDTDIIGSPSAVVLPNNILVFHNGGSSVWYNTYKISAEKWLGDNELTDTLLHESPSATIFEDKVWVFHRGKNDNSLWYNVGTYTRSNPSEPDSKAEYNLSWSGDARTGVNTNKSPFAIVLGTDLYVYYLDEATAVLRCIKCIKRTDQGVVTYEWTDQQQSVDVQFNTPVQVVSSNNKLFVFYNLRDDLRCVMLENGVWTGIMMPVNSNCVYTPKAIVM